jgi:hypothetical protein
MERGRTLRKPNGRARTRAQPILKGASPVLLSRARPFAPPDPAAKDWPDGNRRQQGGDDEQRDTSGARRATPKDRQQSACGHRRNRHRVVRVKEDALPRRQGGKLCSSPRGSEPLTPRLLFGSRVPLGRRRSQPLSQPHRRDSNETENCERQSDRKTHSHSVRLRRDARLQPDQGRPSDKLYCLGADRRASTKARHHRPRHMACRAQRDETNTSG